MEEGEKEAKGVPTKKVMKERKDFIGRSELEQYQFKVDWLKKSGITSTEDINEVRNFVSSYVPSEEKYNGHKQRLLKEISQYQSSIQ